MSLNKRQIAAKIASLQVELSSTREALTKCMKDNNLDPFSPKDAPGYTEAIVFSDRYKALEIEIDNLQNQYSKV